ncbi:MAG: hypothetical protein E7326_00090 [Clostridiales bacterium]|nr:hypothetical protein [Clostridiales bacterium]
MTGFSREEEKRIRLDRMRYTKNSLSSSLSLLAIVFNVFYFVSIYESDVGSWYYKILIGASIVYNLVFMLMVFLASEGVKNYRIGYAYLLLPVGLGQILRIFILPLQAYRATVTISKIDYPVMESRQFIFVVLWLALSAVCCLLAGVIGVQRSKKLQAYNASLEQTAA